MPLVVVSDRLATAATGAAARLGQEVCLRLHHIDQHVGQHMEQCTEQYTEQHVEKDGNQELDELLGLLSIQ